MGAFEIKDRRLATYIRANAPIEELAMGFRATACMASIRAGISSEKYCCHIGLPTLAFGGPMKNWLFILASHTLYAVFLNRRGIQWP